MNALLSADTGTLLALLAFAISAAALCLAITHALRAADRKIERYISIHAAPAPRYTLPAWLEPDAGTSSTNEVKQ